MPMFLVTIPAVPAVVIGALLEIANFDMLPVQDLWNKVFYMPPCYPLAAQYVSIGMQDN